MKKYLLFIFLCGTRNLTQIRVQMNTYQICFSVHNILPRRCARYIGTKNVLHHSNIRDWIRNLTNFFNCLIKDLHWQNVSFPLHAALLYPLYRVVWTSIDIDGLTMGPQLSNHLLRLTLSIQHQWHFFFFWQCWDCNAYISGKLPFVSQYFGPNL